MTDKKDNAQDKTAVADEPEGNNPKKPASRYWSTWLILVVFAAAAVIYNMNPGLVSLNDIKKRFSDSVAMIFNSGNGEGEAVNEASNADTSNPEPTESQNTEENASSALRDEITELRNRVTALEGQTLSVQSASGENAQPHGPSTPSGEVESLQKRLTQLEENILKQSETAAKQEALAQDIATLKSAIVAISGNDNAAEHVSSIKLLLAFDRMERAVTTEQPYIEELSELSPLIAADENALPLIQHLKQYAIDGVPSITQLARNASNASKEVIKLLQDQDQTLSGRMSKAFSSVVSIRKIDAAPEESNLVAHMEYIELLAEENRLKEVLSELQKIENAEITKLFADWQQQAEFVLSVPGTLSDLRKLVHSAALATSTHDKTGADHAP